MVTIKLLPSDELGVVFVCVCSCEQRKGVLVFTRQPTGGRGSDAGSRLRGGSCRRRRRNGESGGRETDRRDSDRQETGKKEQKKEKH